jgi:hypothetical protein
MMRNTYYQSSGNPIQIARLPATRPTIEFLAAGKSRSEALRRAAASVAIMAIASIVTLVLLEAGQLLTWFEPAEPSRARPSDLSDRLGGGVSRTPDSRSGADRIDRRFRRLGDFTLGFPLGDDCDRIPRLT